MRLFFWLISVAIVVLIVYLRMQQLVALDISTALACINLQDTIHCTEWSTQ